MLKMLEAILHGKIATENIDTTGHKRLGRQVRWQLRRLRCLCRCLPSRSCERG